MSGITRLRLTVLSIPSLSEEAGTAYAGKMDSLVGKRGEEKRRLNCESLCRRRKGVLFHHTDCQPKLNGSMLLWLLWGS